MKLGDLEFHVLVDGYVSLDGGAMFGVIPKVMWEKKIPADARNRIQLAMNCLLVHAGGKRILVETGIGAKMSAKLRDIYGVEGPFLERPARATTAWIPAKLISSSTRICISITAAGTRAWKKTKSSPRIPTRNMSCSAANSSTPSIPTSATAPATSRKITCRWKPEAKLALLEGDRAIAPGVELIRVPGHTANMQCVKLTGGGKTAFFLADLVPTTAHLPLPWIMGYDLYPDDHARK